jgi:hypothetical protein
MQAIRMIAAGLGSGQPCDGASERRHQKEV